MGENWSGEATRNAGFVVEETRVDISIGEESNALHNAKRKETPIWMTESTVITNDSAIDSNRPSESVIETISDSSSATTAAGKTDDIMSVLLAHEKRATNNTANAVKSLNNESDSSSDEMADVKMSGDGIGGGDDVETMDSDDDEDDGSVPTVTVGNKTYSITDINDGIIAEMTQAEKEVYVQVFQDYYSHMNY